MASAPFSNGTPTFKTERDSGYPSPIFKIKTDSVSGKIHLPFPALEFLEASLSFQKIALEFGFRTKNTRFFLIFKVKGIGLILCKTSTFYAQIKD